MRISIKRAAVVLEVGLLVFGASFLLWWFSISFSTVLSFSSENSLFLGAFILGLFLITLWLLPKWQVSSLALEPKDHAKQEDEFRRTLAQILGGAVVLAGIYFSMENLHNTEKSLKVSQEGQITDRFTKAINQLGENGTEKLPVRLGGIYALEQISESEEAANKYHWPIMEVLTAYVREKAPRKEESAPPKRSPPGKKQTQEKDPTPPKLDADIQAILTVIGRHTRTLGRGERQNIDLHGTDLRGANLFNANLQGVNLYGANLQGVNLAQANLQEADLRGADLQGAILTNTILTRADLFRADLSKARLWVTDLRQATLQRTDLRGASLDGADLRGADLALADLGGASLRRAVVLGRGSLEITFTKPNMKAFVLGRGDRKGEVGTNLSGVSFHEANLKGADLSETTGLTKEQIQSAIIDEKTQLPEDLKAQLQPAAKQKEQSQ